MLFRVSKDGHGMQTDQISCIPTRQELLSMQKNGYKFQLNGKSATVSQITKFVEGANK